MVIIISLKLMFISGKIINLISGDRVSFFVHPERVLFAF